jgi:hypothetical protein
MRPVKILHVEVEEVPQRLWEVEGQSAWALLIDAPEQMFSRLFRELLVLLDRLT